MTNLFRNKYRSSIENEVRETGASPVLAWIVELFKSRLRKNIESKLSKLEKQWYDNHVQMQGLKITLEPKKWIPLEIKNYEIEKQIKLLKSLL